MKTSFVNLTCTLDEKNSNWLSRHEALGGTTRPRQRVESLRLLTGTETLTPPIGSRRDVTIAPPSARTSSSSGSLLWEKLVNSTKVNTKMLPGYFWSGFFFFSSFTQSTPLGTHLRVVVRDRVRLSIDDRSQDSGNLSFRRLRSEAKPFPVTP